MNDWPKYRRQPKDRFAELDRLSPATLRGMAQFDAASAMSARIDAKTRELIAIAVGVTTRCDGCISFHVDAAIEHGASRGEIADALSVAIALNAGAALVYSARALDALGRVDRAEIA